MARGLSPLQKRLLRMTYANYLTRDPRFYTDLLYTEALVAIWGLESTPRWLSDVAERYPGRGSFPRATAEDRRRYNVAMASLSRSVDRLINRGLVYWNHSQLAEGWTGFELTEEGLAVAQALEDQAACTEETPSPAPSGPPCNRYGTQRREHPRARLPISPAVGAGQLRLSERSGLCHLCRARRVWPSDPAVRAGWQQRPLCLPA